MQEIRNLIRIKIYRDALFTGCWLAQITLQASRAGGRQAEPKTHRR
jgi:hypothetical protein